MLVLDTDHLGEFDDASAAGARLNERLLASGEELAATIVSVHEQLRGWLAQIHRLHADPYAQIPAYARLQRGLEFSPALTASEKEVLVICWGNTGEGPSKQELHLGLESRPIVLADETAPHRPRNRPELLESSAPRLAPGGFAVSVCLRSVLGAGRDSSRVSRSAVRRSD